MEFSSTVISRYGLVSERVLWQIVTLFPDPADAPKTPKVETASAITAAPITAKIPRLLGLATCCMMSPFRRCKGTGPASESCWASEAQPRSEEASSRDRSPSTKNLVPQLRRSGEIRSSPPIVKDSTTHVSPLCASNRTPPIGAYPTYRPGRGEARAGNGAKRRSHDANWTPVKPCDLLGTRWPISGTRLDREPMSRLSCGSVAPR
jgi:hypothetical protein